MVAEELFPLVLTLFWSAFLVVVVIRWRTMTTERAAGNSLLGIGWLLYSLVNLSDPEGPFMTIFVTGLAVLAWAGAVVLLYRDLQDDTSV